MCRLICGLILLFILALPASACIVSGEFKRDHFAKADLDKNGQFSFDEFFVINQGAGTYGETKEFEQQQKEFFAKLDHDHSGQLSFEEYWSVSPFKCM